MDWDDVRYFLALARDGSVRGAGASLGVSHSTVARRVESLEGKLAARLFDRHRDGYVLTDAGRHMMPYAERVEREMAALERGLTGQDERLAGPVCLTCCDEYVGEVMLGALTSLTARYPEIEIHLVADSRTFDLSKREADIAVRILARNVEPPPHLIGARLAPVVLGSYVATAHADRLDPEREGTEARWIGPDDRRTAQLLIGTSSYADVPVWGGFSTLGLMVQAARAGLGIVMLPCYVADPDPTLQRLARPDLRHVADLWLLSHPDLRTNARLRAAREAVAGVFREQESRFLGGADDPA